jgi:hypothetical protein
MVRAAPADNSRSAMSAPAAFLKVLALTLTVHELFLNARHGFSAARDICGGRNGIWKEEGWSR